MKGIFAFVSSANTEEPDLVIAKFTFGKNSMIFLLKLNNSYSIFKFL